MPGLPSTWEMVMDLGIFAGWLFGCLEGVGEVYV